MKQNLDIGDDAPKPDKRYPGLRHDSDAQSINEAWLYLHAPGIEARASHVQDYLMVDKDLRRREIPYWKEKLS